MWWQVHEPPVKGMLATMEWSMQANHSVIFALIVISLQESESIFVSL